MASLVNLFRPTSVAIIGATEDTGNPGGIIMRNLLEGKFLGPVMPVTTEFDSVMGLDTYASIDTLPLTPDLAVICSHPDTIPEYIEELGKRGTHAAVILSQGYFRYDRERREVEESALLAAAKKYGVRILGPNCLGYINPAAGVNASLAPREALFGKVAFVTQSDALFTSVLDWATSKGIGFSHFISLGDRFDIHFEDVLDYLNNDPNTRAVLLYLETIANARHFMSAARALARNKPVLVLKAGRSEAGATAAAAHSGMLLGSDDVYDTAIRRAGMLRVYDIDILFDAAETLALAKPLKGDKLAIITNGGSPGFLATDVLILRGGKMAKLSDETLHQLGEELGNEWSHSNPLILKSDAPGEQYAKAIKIVLQDKQVDGVLVMHAPHSNVDSTEIAEHVAKACKRPKKVVLTSWMGIDSAEDARKVFAKAKIPSFFTPEKAIRAFLNLVEYRANQEMLVEAPPSLPDDFAPETFTARGVVASALEDKRQMLTAREVETILKAYDVPVAEVRHATTALEALEAAKEIGFPVALKVESPNLYRKSLSGGVVLDITDEEEMLAAAEAVVSRVRGVQPNAQIAGFTVQKMSRKAYAREIAIETATDPVFGPIIRFGQGGSLATVSADKQTALPPLNMNLARELVRRTSIHPSLEGGANFPAADLDAVHLMLVKVSQLVIDIPEIFEMEIDPIYAAADGLVALDANIRVAWTKQAGTEQLAIRPYPKELEECAMLKDDFRVDIRPIRPEDEPEHWDFLEHMSPQDKRYRFFGNVASLPRAEMVKLTQIDYDREMAFVAKGESSDGQYATLGVARAMIKPDNSSAEFAVAVRSDMKRVGLGRMLMDKIIRYLKSRNTKRIKGEALGDNKNMIELARNLGFTVTKDYEEDIYNFDLSLEKKAKPEE